MTNREIAIRIEDVIHYQGNEQQTRRQWDNLLNELLGDPTGRELKAVQLERKADFWKNDRRPEAPEHEAYWRGLAEKVRGGDIL